MIDDISLVLAFCPPLDYIALNVFDSIHPASRGVAAHTAGLFWIVTHIYIYVCIYIYGFVSQNSDEAYVHVRNRHVFTFPPRGGFPS